MTDLERWMRRKDWDDSRLADALEIDRSHASRLRRGKSGASPATARRLQKLTRIAWHKFIRAGEAAISAQAL